MLNKENNERVSWIALKIIKAAFVNKRKPRAQCSKASDICLSYARGVPIV